MYIHIYNICILRDGAAQVRSWALWGILRLCTILFGSSSPRRGDEARQRLVRDFPADGDASYTHSQERLELPFEAQDSYSLINHMAHATIYR